MMRLCRIWLRGKTKSTISDARSVENREAPSILYLLDKVKTEK